MKECYLYERLEKDKIQCLACSHFCKISDGKTGICGVRQSLNGKLYLLTYGKAVAANIDPIEKKPLFHFLPGTFIYSIGTPGCNFRCSNCQNFDISQIYGLKGRIEEYGKIFWGKNLTPEKIIEEAIKNNCPSIAYTYNEPTIFLEYALDAMKLAKEKGLKNVWVSNGFMSDKTLETIIPYLDAINIDIKSFDEKFYQKICGARLGPVLENCKRLVHPVRNKISNGARKIWLEITTLIIPTLSDDEKMLKKIAKFIKAELGDFVPWHISAFSGAISWKLGHLPDTSVETIKNAYEIGKRTGLKYVYAGNVLTKEMENTSCPICQKTVIERFGYHITRYDKEGRCPYCGEELNGIF